MIGILKTGYFKQLKNCPIEWLDPSGVGLAVALQDLPKRRVWFPEDKNGEPHNNNPDNGFGGAKFKIKNICPIFVTKNGELPNEDHSNVLEGSEAISVFKAAKKAIDHKKTSKYYRKLMSDSNKFDIKNMLNYKELLWNVFQENVDSLQEPTYSYIGLAWRSLFGRRKRLEEIAF